MASKDNGSQKAVLEPAARMKELVSVSHEISVDKAISISRYFNSGKELLKTAAGFEEKGEIEKAFVLYLRYMTLFVEKLVHHPEYAKYDRNEKTAVKNECNRIFDLAEGLKKKILEKYTKEYEESKKNPASPAPTAPETVLKRTVGPDGSAPPSHCDIDDIDKKFDFSKLPEPSQKLDFDPFNIEELKKSFDEERK